MNLPSLSQETRDFLVKVSDNPQKVSFKLRLILVWVFLFMAVGTLFSKQQAKQNIEILRKYKILEDLILGAKYEKHVRNEK